MLLKIGYHPNKEFEQSAEFDDGKNGDFWITESRSVVPLHLAFEVKSRGDVENLHRVALMAGAKDNGGPGYREYSPGYFAAFVLDPDGHNIEAVWYDPAKEK